ncbi:phosphate signaling complex protein PhoU [Serpentinimonas barnesii]|uniref:phosphate signaling complex protein PhoU n=1 Tax=Serpentinimonas barnesii TaxID=1458427 RepID=UPI00049577FF|nr:phosphate signaling complex protein PhoU [Serpentinimonas barnesii]
MSDKHFSTQFESELAHVTARVLEMGGVVESQLRQCIHALHHLSTESTGQVLEIEKKVNLFELEIDHEIISIMSRRQPTARDLRLLIGISRVITNLERAGDKSTRIARMVDKFIQSGAPRALPVKSLGGSAQLAATQIHRALDAFARLDVQEALAVINDDDQLDVEYEAYFRELSTYMMQDSRLIGSSIHLMFLAKAIERIGDLAKNIAEATIYVVKGTDVRHSTDEERRSVLQ